MEEELPPDRRLPLADRQRWRSSLPTAGKSTETEELVSLASQELEGNGGGREENGRDSRGARTLYHHSYSSYIVHQMISIENGFKHTIRAYEKSVIIHMDEGTTTGYNGIISCIVVTMEINICHLVVLMCITKMSP